MPGKLKRPPTPERLQQAARLLTDGASQHEVTRTTGIARETLRKHFPRQGWTFVEGGKFRALTRKEKTI
jgi:DNA invertase Pin-like site-specific DNA recombinase